MTRPRRFLFDECIGKPTMEEIHKKVYSELSFDHICVKYFTGIRDEVWIPKLRDDEFEYVVISADNGRQSIRGEKLPELCREYGVTHLLLSNTLSQKLASIKQAAIIEHWSRIVTLHDEIPGSRFQLRHTSRTDKSGANRVVVTLVPIDYAELDRKLAERVAKKRQRHQDRDQRNQQNI